MCSGKQLLQRLLTRLSRENDGPTATEYAVLLALIAAVSIAAIGSIGRKFATLYTIIAGSLPEGFG